jgi:hypothetical protein
MIVNEITKFYRSKPDYYRNHIRRYNKRGSHEIGVLVFNAVCFFVACICLACVVFN